MDGMVDDIAEALNRSRLVVSPEFDAPMTLSKLFFMITYKSAEAMQAQVGKDLLGQHPWTPVEHRDFVIAGWLAKDLFIGQATDSTQQQFLISTSRRSIMDAYGVTTEEASWSINLAFELTEQPHRLAEYGRYVIRGFPADSGTYSSEMPLATVVSEGLADCVRYSSTMFPS